MWHFSDNWKRFAHTIYCSRFCERVLVQHRGTYSLWCILYGIIWYIVSSVVPVFCSFLWHLFSPIVITFFDFIVLSFRRMIIPLSMSIVSRKKRTLCNMMHVDDGCDVCRSSVRLNNRTKQFIINRPLVLVATKQCRVIMRLSSTTHWYTIL